MEDNPWKTLRSDTKYDNPWLRVDEHQVTRPDGKPGIYGTIHFKNHAVGIVPLTENKEVWLVGQYRYPLKAYSWEIPAGGGPLSGDPREAAERELKEETGLVAQSWDTLVKVHLSNSITDEGGTIFLAKELSQGQANPEPTEQLRIEKVPLELALNRIDSGEITDALTILGLLRLKLRLTA